MKTVTEIAKKFNISSHAIRYYSKLGLLSPQRDGANGYRLYGLEDEKRLQFLLSAKSLGFTLKNIRAILFVTSSGDSPCLLVRKILDQRLEAVRKEIRVAHLLMSRMELAVNSWQERPNRIPSGNSICNLIEVWADTHPRNRDMIAVEE